MTEAGRGIQSVQVTEAVRNATIGGKKVKHGQTIALDPDDGLVAVDGNRDKAVLRAVASFQPGYELITLYYGADSTLGRGRGDGSEDRRCVARRGGRGRPRRAAALPLPHLRRVGVAGTTARRPAKPATAKPAPPPTDPAALLDTDIAGSGLAAANILKRAGRRLGFFTVRELLFHLPRRYDDLREMRQLGELYLVEEGTVVSARVRVVDVRVEPSFRRRIQRTIARPRGRDRDARGDVVRAALHRAAAPPRRPRRRRPAS